MTNVQTAIDPMAMARFLVLPGASRLLEAFARIPPGALRDSVIHHAEVIAEQYTGAAQPGQPMPDPLAAFAAPVEPPQRQLPASRTGSAPKTESKEAQAIKMRMEGVRPAIIADRLGMPVSEIYHAITQARRAGIKIPKDELKGVKDGNKRWVTSMDQLSGQGAAGVEKAAMRRGIDPQAYLDRRALTLKMAMEGASWETILKATGETDSKVCSAWLSVARAAGFRVPYVTFLQGGPAEPVEPAQEPAQDAQVVPVGRVFPRTTEATDGRASATMRKAAERRGMTLQAYEDLRESIVRHRLEGKPHAIIAALTGMTEIMVKDTIQLAKERYGVTFPPTVRGPAQVIDFAAQRKATGG